MITASTFVNEMDRHWRDTLGNESSEPLHRSWGQMADAFIDHVKAHDDPEREGNWTVLSPPTGSGKTEGTIIYCAMLGSLLETAPEQHPGVLIVTKLIEDADSIGGRINLYARNYAPHLGTAGTVAVAYHSGCKQDRSLEELRYFPVLVITHRAYEIALDILGSGSSIPMTWEYFHTYANGRRKLVIIDEAIDLIEEAQVDADALAKLLVFLPRRFQEKFPQEIALLRGLDSFFRTENVKTGDQPATDRMITKEPLHGHLMVGHQSPSDTTCDLGKLRSALREVRFDQGLWRWDTKEDQRLRGKFGELLRDIDINLKSWTWYSKSESRDTLNTARLLVPEDAKGAVILDATASCNVIYDIFDRARPIAPIPGTRNYSNVTLHISHKHKTGKFFMRRNAKDLSAKLLADLETRLQGKTALIVTHKDVEPYLQKEVQGFTFDVAHWGAINGSNKWRYHDTVVLFGLPYRPDTWPLNVFMAFQGAQDTEWITSTGDRPFKRHRDIKEAIIKGQLVTDIVQAINRIRCRRVIDPEGHCPAADVHIMLPSGERGEAILEGIRLSMPGIQVQEWEYAEQKRRVKKTKHEEALKSFFRCMSIGRAAVTWVRRELDIPATSLDRLIARIKANDPADSLVQTLAELGISYETERAGRATRAFFTKTLPA